MVTGMVPIVVREPGMPCHRPRPGLRAVRRIGRCTISRSERTTRRGRKRLYKDAVSTPPKAQGQEHSGWQTCVIRVRGKDRHLRIQVTGPWVIKKAADHPDAHHDCRDWTWAWIVTTIA